MKKQILFREKVKLFFLLNPTILWVWKDIARRKNRIQKILVGRIIRILIAAHWTCNLNNLPFDRRKT